MGDAVRLSKDDALQGAPDSLAHLQHRIAELEQELINLRRHAYHDALTGLPNRTLLRDRIAQVMVQPARKLKTTVLLLLDLNGFKRINDRFGHSAGDLLLQLTAKRLLDCIRGCDTVCRYGGDEFVVMLSDIDVCMQAEQMDAVMQKIHAQLSAPYPVEGELVTIGVSIGAASVHDGYANCDELIKAADTAMYRAKPRSTGRSQGKLNVTAAYLNAPRQGVQAQVEYGHVRQCPSRYASHSYGVSSNSLLEKPDARQVYSENTAGSG